MEAALVLAAYERTGNPTLVARNVYAETVETPAGTRMQLRARPGMAELASVGAGPLRGAFQKDGLFDSKALIVSRETLYAVTAAGVATAFTGTIAGSGLVDIAIGQDADLNSVAYIATGTKLYKATGTAVTEETLPGGSGSTATDFHRAYPIAVESGSDKFYYQVPGGSSWEPLDFASAEFAPDRIVAVRTRGDQIAMLGATSFEPFALSGDAANPITPYGGLAANVGCRSRDAAKICGDTLIFVDDKCNVRRWDGGELRIISGPGLAEIIAGVEASELAAWTFSIPGHEFYVLRIGSVATWVYDLSEPGERWTTWDSYGLSYWRAQIGCNIGDTVLACDAESAQVFTVSVDEDQDGDEYFATEFSAILPAAEAPQSVANLVLNCAQGLAPRTGEGSEPTVQMKWSDNGANSFTDWRERPMGATGNYNRLPRWNGLGRVPAHFDRIFRFRCSDPIDRVFKAAKVNVP